MYLVYIRIIPYPKMQSTSFSNLFCNISKKAHLAIAELRFELNSNVRIE